MLKSSIVKSRSLLLSVAVLILFAVPAQCKVSRDSSPEELKSIAKSISELPNPTPEQLLDQANAYRWLKDYKSAIKTLDKLVAMRPTDGVARAFRGVMYKFDERFNDARVDLDKAESLGYRRPNLYAERAVVLLCLSEYSDALKDANKAADAEPGNPDHLILIGRAKSQLGKPEDGLSDVNKALQLDPNNADALAVRAAIYKRVGRMKEAKADWAQAHSLGWNEPL